MLTTLDFFCAQNIAVLSPICDKLFMDNNWSATSFKGPVEDWIYTDFSPDEASPRSTLDPVVINIFGDALIFCLMYRFENKKKHILSD